MGRRAGPVGLPANSDQSLYFSTPWPPGKTGSRRSTALPGGSRGDSVRNRRPGSGRLLRAASASCRNQALEVYSADPLCGRVRAILAVNGAPGIPALWLAGRYERRRRDLASPEDAGLRAWASFPWLLLGDRSGVLVAPRPRTVRVAGNRGGHCITEHSGPVLLAIPPGRSVWPIEPGTPRVPHVSPAG